MKDELAKQKEQLDSKPSKEDVTGVQERTVQLADDLEKLKQASGDKEAIKAAEDATNAKIQELKDEVAKLREQVEAKPSKEDVNGVQEKATQLGQEVDNLKKRAGHYATKEDLGDIRKKQDNLRDDIDKVRDDLTKCCGKDDVDKLERKVAELSAAVDQLKSLSELKERTNKLEDENGALKSGQDAMSKKLDDLKHELETVKGDLNKKATNDALDLVKSEVDSKAPKSTLDELNKAIQDLQSRAGKLEEELETIKAHLKPTNDELNTQLNDAKDEIQQLKDKLANVATMDDLQQLRDRLARLAAELQASKAGIEVTERSVQQASETEEMAQKLQELKKALDNKLDRDAIKEDFVMKGDFKNFKDSVEQFRSECATKAELAKLSELISALKSDVQNLKVNMEKVAAKDDLLALKERVDAIDRALADLNKLADQVANIPATYVTKEEFNPTKHLADKNKEQTDAHQKAIASLEDRLAQLGDSVKDVASIKAHVDRLDDMVKELRDEVNALKEMPIGVQERGIELGDDDAAKSAPASEEAMRLIAIIRGDVNNDKKQIDALRQKIDEVGNQVNSFTATSQKVATLEHQIVVLSDQLKQLGAKDSATELRKQLQSALSQIRQELNNLKSEIEKIKAAMGNNELRTEITNWVETRLSELHTQLHKESTDNAMSIRRLASQVREQLQQIQTRDTRADTEYLVRDVDRLKRIVDRLVQEEEQQVGGSGDSAAASPEVIKAIRQLKAAQARLTAESAQVKMELYACMKMSESIIYSVQTVLPTATASGVGTKTLTEHFETINNHSTRLSSMQLDIDDIKDTIADILSDRDGRAMFIDPGVPQEGNEMTFENPLTGPVPEGGVEELRSYMERLRMYLVQLKKELNKVKAAAIRARPFSQTGGEAVPRSKKTKKNAGAKYGSID